MASQSSSHRTGDPARATTTTADASGTGVIHVQCRGSTVVRESVRCRVIVEGDSGGMASPRRR
jgi:hypothetical protein